VSPGREGVRGLRGTRGGGEGGRISDLTWWWGVSPCPDPAQDEELLLDGKKVLVCQGKPIPMPAYRHSSCSQSEYLIYQEIQCRIRYLIQLRF